MDKYKIIDGQGADMFESLIFDNKNEIIKQLCDFHSLDYTDERYTTIQDMFEGEKLTEEQQLSFLCDYGVWEVVEVK
jgi:hypothetical protein